MENIKGSMFKALDVLYMIAQRIKYKKKGSSTGKTKDRPKT